MANFNLLPWRERKRELKKQQFFAGIGAVAIIASSSVFAAHLFMQDKVDYQASRNQFLEKETKILDKKIKEIKTLDDTRQALMDRIKVIEELQSTRPAIVHLFDEMVASLPKGMYLTHLQQKNTQVSLEGKAESNARVSSYMNKLNASSWLSSSNLQLISREDSKSGDTGQLRDFRLAVTQLLKARKNKKPQQVVTK